MAVATARAGGRPWTRDLGFLLAILAIAAGIRMWGPRAEVFTPQGVSFLESDAWYHVRLVENQARNFPFRVTHDPYASPDGMYVPVAPLFDTVIATAVVLSGGTAPGTDHVARVAAFVPPVLGVLAVALVYALGRLAFGSRAALLAATLAAILPGHFLDRTLLGYVDHHALEVALALAVLLTLGRVAIARDGAGVPSPRDLVVQAALPGTMLGWYLLGWSSGALLIAVLGAWLLLQALADAWTGRRDGGLARVTAAAALVALAWVLAFQHPDMHRYGSQVVALAGLAALGAALDLARRFAPGRRAVVALVAGGVAAAAVAALAVRVIAPGVVATIVGDVLRFAPDPSRKSVLEARPLFLFSGAWDWWQPWTFFRSGFYVGVPALALLWLRGAREARPLDLLIATWGLAMLAATLGQNRFGYYLTPALALGAGWLAACALDWGGVPEQGVDPPARRVTMPFARALAVVAVAGAVFGPNLVPALNTTARGAPLIAPWRAATEWLRTATPEPFGDAEYYLARYDEDRRRADHTVMAWWDYGYWLVERARRVPVANPTQEGASTAARFFAAADEAEALALVDEARARYVVVDFEMPFTMGQSGFRGKYHALAAWTGEDPARDYAMYFQPDGAGGVRALPLFHESYYKSMAFRLYAAGGEAMPSGEATVVRWLEQPTVAPGSVARTIVEVRDFPRLDDARAYLASLGAGRHRIVGRDPLRSPFPVAALTGLRLAWEAPERYSDLHGLPAIRIFERTTARP